MSTSRLTRFALTGGTAALCVGLAAPAAVATASTPAHDTGGTTSTVSTSTVSNHHPDPSMTFAQKQAMVEKFLTARINDVVAAKAYVAADANLTPAQQSSITAKLNSIEDALAAVRTKVEAATTPAEIDSALTALPHPVFGHIHHTMKQHKAFAPKTTSPKSKPATATLTKATTTKPAHTAHVRTVTVHHGFRAGRSGGPSEHGRGHGDGFGGHHGGGHR
jgi:hypothetical protein